MRRDRLHVVQAVRRRVVEQARQILASCLQNEADIIDKIRSIDDTQARDNAARSTIEDAYLFQELFVRRAQARHAERRTAEAELAAAEGRSAEARLAVVAARTDAEAVETLMDERAAAATAEADRRTQHALDDMARGRGVAANRLGSVERR